MINLPPYPKDTEPQWDGLTLEQMQMRRTLVQARMEIQKFKLAAQMDACKQKSSFLGGEKSIFSRVAGAFTFAEYAFLVLRLFRTVGPLFKKRK